MSYTNSTRNPVTDVPTADSLLWEKGKMTDLGTFGGGIFINNRGQVMGQSNLAGDLVVHGFFGSGECSFVPDGASGTAFRADNWANELGAVA